MSDQLKDTLDMKFGELVAEAKDRTRTVPPKFQQWDVGTSVDFKNAVHKVNKHVAGGPGSVHLLRQSLKRLRAFW